jgi:superfamily II DNA or RNA helicase/HKD family nuclease
MYDQLVTSDLASRLASAGGQRQTQSDPPGNELLRDHLVDAFRRELGVLLDAASAGDPEHRELAQLHLVNELLRRGREILRAEPNASSQPLFEEHATPRVLKAVFSDGPAPQHPETGLAFPWLFTAGKDTPALLSELRRELSSCDQVDILVSFIKFAGVRKLEDILRRLTAIDASGRTRTKIRVLTTVYMGVTEQHALDVLGRMPGCEVRVSLDGRRTRLHAKAWIFGRKTGFGAAYIGSANITGSALVGGLEWTLKFTQRGQADVYERARAQFESLWNDAEFQEYNPDNEDHRAALAESLRREHSATGLAAPHGLDSSRTAGDANFTGLAAKPYQQEMLDALASEREHGRTKSLLVAATGTGKTVVAALDYQSMATTSGGLPRILFVAHREDILVQARDTFRNVLRRQDFGQLLVGGNQPTSHEHLFSSFQSLLSRDLIGRLGPDYWHAAYVDECHHLAAGSFSDLVAAIRPKYLVGLTATPERADGRPLAPFFDMRPDGSAAVELRLWDALELQLLTPFEYYGCNDPTDFRSVDWSRPAEAEARLDEIVTGNTTRAKVVIDEWHRLVRDPRRCRAVAFCVSVLHARFMTEQFCIAGLPALCVTGDTPPEARAAAKASLERGEVCVVVTVDLYNEGVDLPYIDTLLLLRPTQSPVVFQQQIGRGLRLARGKETCLVLDFVGQHNDEFRFDRLLSPLTGLPRVDLAASARHGFSRLPPGCTLILSQQSQDRILENLRRIARNRWSGLIAELRTYVALRGVETTTLARFLQEQQIPVDEVYRDAGGQSGWTKLRRDAGLIASHGPDGELDMGRRFHAWLHVDDTKRIDLIRALGTGRSPPTNDDDDRLLLQMAFYQVDSERRAGPGRALVDRLARYPELRRELTELADFLDARGPVRWRPIPGTLGAPLCLHAGYKLWEILAGVGHWTEFRRPPHQSGVLQLTDRRAELLLVTLDKSKGFGETVSYHDYALSPTLFHWQSQNAAAPTTSAGQRYIHGAEEGWTFHLFVRINRDSPYRACGPVRMRSWEGGKPMSITWDIETPLPPRLYQAYSVLRRC